LDARAPRIRYRDLINRPGGDGSLSRIETLEQQAADALARITEESEVWANGVEAVARRTTTLEARFGSASSEVSIIAQAIAQADAAFAQYQIALATQISAIDGEIEANADATLALDARVTYAEGSITAQSGLIVDLDSRISGAEDDILANANAILGLDTRVTYAEGSIVAQSGFIVDLEASVGDLEATAQLFLDAFVDSGTGEVVSRFGFNLTAYGVVTSMEAIAQNGPTGPVSEIVFGGTTSLRSEDYDAGVAGWLIDSDGTAEFNDIIVRGSIYESSPAFFYVTKSGDQTITGNGTRDKLTWETETSDPGNVFASSTFTAPVAGIYGFLVILRHSGGGTNIQKIVEFRKNGTDNIFENLLPETDETGAQDLTFFTPIQLAASDTVEAYMEINDTGGASYTISSGNTRFVGFLMQRL